MHAPFFTPGPTARPVRLAPALALGGALCLALTGCGGPQTTDGGFDSAAGPASSTATAAGRASSARLSSALDGSGPASFGSGAGGSAAAGSAGLGNNAAPAGEPLTLLYPTGERATSSLLVAKQLPLEVNLNRPFDYTIAVTNLTGEPIDGVVLNEPLPSHLQLQSATPPPSSETGGEAQWTLNLGPGSTQVINLTALATEAKPIRQCSTVTYDPTLCSQVAVVSPTLNLTMRAPELTLQCQGYEVIYAVSNNGTGTARGVVIRETLPEGVLLDDGANEVRIDVGDVPAGKTVEFKRVIRPSTTGTVTLAGEATGANGLVGQAQGVSTSVTEAKLVLTAEAPERRFIGRPFTHTFTVRNTGDGPAPRTVVSVVVPEGASVASVDNNGAVRPGGVTWQLGELAPGAERTVSLDLSGTQQAVIQTVAAARADCVVEDASVSVATELEGIPALLMEVVDLIDPVTVGDETTYVITVTNQGSAQDQNVQILCEAEDSMSFVSGAGTTAVTAEGGSIRMAPVAGLNPGEVATWQVTVRAESEADARFTVTLTSEQLQRPVRETESTNLYE